MLQWKILLFMVTYEMEMRMFILIGLFCLELIAWKILLFKVKYFWSKLIELESYVEGFFLSRNDAMENSVERLFLSRIHTNLEMSLLVIN
jgi:hypothetical protein